MTSSHTSIPDWAKRVGVLVADIEQLEKRLAEKKAELDSLGPQQTPEPVSDAVTELSRGGKREPGEVGNIGYTGQVFELLKTHPFVRYTAGKVCAELKAPSSKRQATQIALVRLAKAGRIMKSDEGGYFFQPEGTTDPFS